MNSARIIKFKKMNDTDWGGTSTSQNNGDSQYYSNMKMQSNKNNIESDQKKKLTFSLQTAIFSSSSWLTSQFLGLHSVELLLQMRKGLGLQSHTWPIRLKSEKRALGSPHYLLQRLKLTFFLIFQTKQRKNIKYNFNFT